MLVPLSKSARAESRGWSYYVQLGVELYRGDCLDILLVLPSSSIDAVICDPPYPEISRPYGRMTEAEWFAMMRALIPEVRRVLKPTGSAVFVLQPNSERVGRMRLWLWEFMAWVGKEWGIVQDVWWWNTAAIPEAHAIQGRLMRPSLKACVWCGQPDCHRDQGAVLWSESDRIAGHRRAARALGASGGRHRSPGGQAVNRATKLDASERRGGVLPFNVIPTAHGPGCHTRVAGSHGHPAGTPYTLCSWWVRYICPPGGTVLDPFSGSSTVGLAALSLGRRYIGVELNTNYFEMSCKRLKEAARADHQGK